MRLERGLTQGQLVKPEYTEAYLSMIEAGRRQPSPKVLGHIATRLGIDVEELTTGRSPGAEIELELKLQEARRRTDEGAFEQARALIKKVLRQARSLELPRTEARCHEINGLIAERTQGANAAMAHYERAVEQWQAEPLHLRAEAIAGLARCTQQLETPQLALHMLDSYRRELEAGESPEPSALMRTLTAMIYPYFAAGLPEKAAEVAREALRLEPRVDDPEELACMHLAVARSLAYERHYDDALHSLRRAEEIYLAGGWRNRVAKAQTNEAIVLAKKAEYEEARSKLLSALELLAESPNRVDEAVALNELGHVYRNLGDVTLAIESLEKARPLLEDSDVIEKAFNERELGLCLAPTEAKAAESYLKRAVDLYRISRDATEVATTLKALGELYIAQGRSDEAFEALKDGIAAVEERSA